MFWFRDIFLVFTLSGCAYLNSSNSNIENISKNSDVKIPSWASEDCIKRNNFYYFVGYGEGNNAASAARNALLASRQNALACLFGGTITSSISIKETSEKSTYESNTDLKLDYSYVNWGGYEAIAGNTFYLNQEHTKIYIQYKWSDVEIIKEKLRLDKLSKKVEETKAMKQEIVLKENVIKEQKDKLAELQKQENELAKIKEESTRAATRLASMREAHGKKQNDIMRVINSLYCGITVEKFIEIFREPDEISFAYGSYGHRYAVFRWGQFLIRDEYSSYARRDDDKIIIDGAKKQIIDNIYPNYGKTFEAIRICRK